ncbi:chemotaxis protein CheB [Sphingomonas sp. Leaf4]|uniref:chemotaxis protein CheB n=1 Tax=Sphingomonas sp. Leaf4 TaxID=2876553 RepID=UPI001E506ED4|nr:chemotaxis protein CheB [Sphingomonas sp. Leaf4]
MTHHDVRVMVIDDSVVTRVIVARIIDAMAGHAVVAAVGGIGAALAVLARERIDVILLDLNLPGIDGLSGLPTLAALAPQAAILVLSATCDDGSAAALHARSLGAVATIAKPASSAMVGRFAERLQTAVVDAVQSPGPAARDAWDVIAIGASTGGIHALAPLLAAIPAECDVPMLLTQHLPASFTGYFAGQLARLARRPVDVGADSLRIRRGRMVLAPGDAHLRVVATTDGAAIRLDRTPAASGCLPSVDPMFESVARVYGARALVVVLSGMGRDGCRGAAQVKAHGGAVAAQERQSSVVWGMPGAVVEAGLATTIGTPEQLGAFIAKGRRPA